MNKRSGITTAETWMVDYTKIVSQFPEEGACTAVLKEGINNGGAPYNLLVDLRRLGADFPYGPSAVSVGMSMERAF